MENLEKAISIAVSYHKYQRDSEGMPKILHPISVLFKMQTIEEMIVAVLHGVVEDTEYTLRELSACKFSSEVIFAPDCITHRVGENYNSYIERVKNSYISIKVKIADLEHNMDLRRIKDPTDEEIIKFIKKYKRAWDELKNVYRCRLTFNSFIPKC